MGLSNADLRKRILRIDGGKFVECAGAAILGAHKSIIDVHLVNVTFRKVDRDLGNGERKYLGDALQLHLINEDDYFVLECWTSSRYAQCFFKMVEGINNTLPISLSASERFTDKGKETSLFIFQDKKALTHAYTKDNPRDCPRLELNPEGSARKYNDTAQILFFMDKIDSVIVPRLRMKQNPFPYHPLFTGITGNNIAGGYFNGDRELNQQRTQMPAAVTPADPDDIPF